MTDDVTEVHAALQQGSERPSRRVAAIFDIHGNVPALEAVLADIRRASVDQVIVGGDVFPGPMPIEVLRLLETLDRPVRFIKGNGDRVVLAAKAGGDISEVPAPYQDTVRWAAEAVTDQEARSIGSWPSTLRCQLAALGDVLFCHATPRSDKEIFTHRTEEVLLRPLFQDVSAPLVVCGHTHMQFDRRVGNTRVVNAGSVGMPFGRTGAYWLLLGHDIELCRTTYDLVAAARRVRATKYPQAEEFATRGILQPPSEEEMLAAYSRAELRGEP